MKNATKKAAINAAILAWAESRRMGHLPWKDIVWCYRHQKKKRR